MRRAGLWTVAVVIAALAPTPAFAADDTVVVRGLQLPRRERE